MESNFIKLWFLISLIFYAVLMTKDYFVLSNQVTNLEDQLKLECIIKENTVLMPPKIGE